MCITLSSVAGAGRLFVLDEKYRCLVAGWLQQVLICSEIKVPLADG
jgi:hypothetical protein